MIALSESRAGKKFPGNEKSQNLLCCSSPLTYKMTEMLKCMFQYLRRDNVISHIPKTRLRVRCVGESETFHFRGDGADDSICILVGLLHHTHIPTAGSQKRLSLTVQAKTSFHNPHISHIPNQSIPFSDFIGYLPNHIHHHQELGEPEHKSYT